MAWPGRREPIIAKFRRTGMRLLMTACLSVFVLIGVGGVTDDFEDSYYAPDSAFAIGSRLVYGVFALGACLIMIRWFRMGIFATPSHLIVRNLLRTRRIPWSEIAGFDRPVDYGSLRNTGLAIRRRDDSVTYSLLYAPGPLNGPDFADHVVTDLRQLHHRLTNPSPAGTGSGSDGGAELG